MKCKRCKHKKFKIYDVLAEVQAPYVVEPVYTLICLNCKSTMEVSRRKYIKTAKADGYKVVEV